jgi:hypothetical protein
VAGEGTGASEVARHGLLGPGQASICDEHYTRRRDHDPLERTPAALHGKEAVDRALGTAALAGRFAEGDLESILVHGAAATRARFGPPPEHSLSAGTAMWSALSNATPEEEDGR